MISFLQTGTKKENVVISHNQTYRSTSILYHNTVTKIHDKENKIKVKLIKFNEPQQFVRNEEKKM